MDDTGEPGSIALRPSRRLRLLYLIYLSFIVWGGVLWWLIPMALSGPSILNLTISFPVLLAILWVVLWIPRYWRSMEYRFSKDSASWSRGVWFRRETEIRCDEIAEVRVVRGPVARLVGISEVRIFPRRDQPGSGKGRIRIVGVRNPDEVTAMICQGLK